MKATTNFADFQPALNSFEKAEGLNDIHQTIKTILETPKGCAALYPNFGSDLHKYLDYPTDLVTPHVVREVLLALEEWEPRIAIQNIRVAFENETTLGIAVTWRLLAEKNKEMTTFLEVARG